MAEDFFDLSGLSDDDWKDMENPSPVPAGWYRAKVADVDEDMNTRNLFLHFQITSGPFKGKKIKETLWNPEHADNDEKKAGSIKRRMLIASRLGLITAADKAKRDQKFRVIWENAQNVEVWIKVEVRTYDKKDKKTGAPTGEKGVGNQLAFDGVFPLSDERVPLDVRNGTAPAPTSTPTAGQPTKPASGGNGGRPASVPAGSISDLI